MEAPKFSSIALFSFSSCAIAQHPIDVNINNSARGCFSLAVSRINLADPTTLTITVDPNIAGDCPCKSSLLNYSAVQQIEGDENILISGVFSPLNVNELQLPLFAQARLIIEDKPIWVNVSCTSN